MPQALTVPDHARSSFRPWHEDTLADVPSRTVGIQIVGDLADAPLPRDVVVDPEVDLVVATGGLTSSAAATMRWLRDTFPSPLPIILVLGPREFSGRDHELTLGGARRLARAKGITLLENASAVVGGVRFVGCTLWTDFRLHGSDEATMRNALGSAEPSFADLDIRGGGDRSFDPGRSTGLHWWSRSWLGLNAPSDLPTVVVTHHAPTGTGLARTPFLDPLAPAHASRADDLVRQSGAVLWVHGGRETVDHVVGETRVVSRPCQTGLPGCLVTSVATDVGGESGVSPRSPTRLGRQHRFRPSKAVPIRQAPSQASLFGVDGDGGPEPQAAQAAIMLPASRRASPSPALERAARILEAHDDYRVLRRVKPRPVDPAYRPRPGEGIALLVDVETTGLDHRQHEVIEIGMVAFAHDAEGRIGPVTGVVGMLHEPKGEIGPEITRLTGITAGMVAGRAIDVSAVRTLVEGADLVIAHNAKFDRAFCERLDESFRHKAWACSVAEVPWRDLGFEGAKLGYLVNGCGLFHDGHRAVDDCHALLEVLAHEVDGASALSHLLRSSRSTRVRVWAERAPFDRKDVLKARGYRWNGGGDGRPKAWWTEVDEAELATELGGLHREVYGREVGLRQDVLTAYERYRPE